MTYYIRLKKQPVPDRVTPRSIIYILSIFYTIDATIKTLAWNSHARQTKALHACSKLKSEFDAGLDDHTDNETKMRHANIKLETEISQMIKKYVDYFVFIEKKT